MAERASREPVENIGHPSHAGLTLALLGSTTFTFADRRLSPAVTTKAIDLKTGRTSSAGSEGSAADEAAERRRDH
jgi:hypothetical protein